MLVASQFPFLNLCVYGFQAPQVALDLRLLQALTFAPPQKSSMFLDMQDAPRLKRNQQHIFPFPRNPKLRAKASSYPFIPAQNTRKLVSFESLGR